MAKSTVCPACATCPEVIVNGDTVHIGDQLAVSEKEWNVLVAVIKSSKVGKV
jgi:hypothetical protein